MNYGDVWIPVLIGSGVTLVGSLLSNAYFYGKLTQKVTQNTEDIHELKQDSDKQWARISTQGEDIAYLQARTGNGRV